MIENLTQPLPAGWQVSEVGDGKVRVVASGPQSVLMGSTRNMGVKAAGQLPTGFDPGSLYSSRFQPRGLQMAIIAATDAVRSIGVDWQVICDAVQPDEMGVYATSAMGQLSDEGLGGLMNSRSRGGRPTSKQVPMGLTSMPADFVNAYVLGNLGHTEAVAGACASFLGQGAHIGIALYHIGQHRRFGATDHGHPANTGTNILRCPWA